MSRTWKWLITEEMGTPWTTEYRVSAVVAEDAAEALRVLSVPAKYIVSIVRQDR